MIFHSIHIINTTEIAMVVHTVLFVIKYFFTKAIFSSDITHPTPMSTFGFSLAGGMDLDNNQYPGSNSINLQ